MKDTKLDYYGAEMTARREKFNKIMNRIDMVLMNNILEVDISVLENWEGESPFTPEPCEWQDSAGDKMLCSVHDGELIMTDDDWQDDNMEMVCDQSEYGNSGEVYQWYAINDSDADWLKRHNQYITYSDMLDTYFLAITHFGTSWDYVDSMVDDILGDK